MRRYFFPSDNGDITHDGCPLCDIVDTTTGVGDIRDTRHGCWDIGNTTDELCPGYDVLDTTDEGDLRNTRDGCYDIGITDGECDLRNTHGGCCDIGVTTTDEGPKCYCRIHTYLRCMS